MKCSRGRKDAHEHREVHQARGVRPTHQFLEFATAEGTFLQRLRDRCQDRLHLLCCLKRNGKGFASQLYPRGLTFSRINPPEPKLPFRAARPFGERNPAESCEHAHLEGRTAAAAAGFLSGRSPSANTWHRLWQAPKSAAPGRKPAAGWRRIQARELHSGGTGQVHHSSTEANVIVGPAEMWANSCTTTFVTSSDSVTFPLSTHSSIIARRNSQIASGRSG